MPDIYFKQFSTNINNQNLIKWKSNTYNQLIYNISKNNTSFYSPFKPNVIKLYRKNLYISNTDNFVNNARTSIKIDDINKPNGTILYNNNNVCGLKIPIEVNIPNSLYEKGNVNCVNCVSIQNNALKRVRSSIGKNKKFTYNNGLTNESYYTSSEQYLNSRNKTFIKNQYNFLRKGDPLIKPGSYLSKDNVYSTNNVCNYFIHISSDLNNNFFSYIWIDGNTYDVYITDGNYDLNTLNKFFNNIMFNNKHYFINNKTNLPLFLLNIAFNYSNNLIELQCIGVNYNVFNSNNYNTPDNEWSILWNDKLLMEDVNKFLVPSFVIYDNNNFKNIIGFNSGNYPDIIPYLNNDLVYQSLDNLNYTYNSNQLFYSTNIYEIYPNYKNIYYKPNNFQFSKQGAVSSSELINRLKYDNINKISYLSDNKFMSNSLTNSFSYGISENAYTQKIKYGFPLNNRPKFSKYKDGFIKCFNYNL